jgi:hypothetical protein
MNNEDPKEPMRLPPGFVIIDPEVPVKKKKPYKRKRRPGPKKRVGRPPNDMSPSPSKREGRRSHTVTVEEIVYIHLKELQKFHKMSSMSKTIAKFIEPAFDKAYQDALSLKKIAERKEKEREEIAARLAAYNSSKGKL